MAAILGLGDASLEAACAAAQARLSGGQLQLARQVVIAGHTAAVERAVVLAKSRGAKRAVTLPVSVPSHSSLMKQAAVKLRERRLPLPSVVRRSVTSARLMRRRDDRPTFARLSSGNWQPGALVGDGAGADRRRRHAALDTAGKVLTGLNRASTPTRNRPVWRSGFGFNRSATTTEDLPMRRISRWLPVHPAESARPLPKHAAAGAHGHRHRHQRVRRGRHYPASSTCGPHGPRRIYNAADSGGAGRWSPTRKREGCRPSGQQCRRYSRRTHAAHEERTGTNRSTSICRPPFDSQSLPETHAQGAARPHHQHQFRCRAISNPRQANYAAAKAG
jgi:hypothetical protein